MTHDFAKKPKPAAKRRKKSKPKTQVPAWVWLFTGVVLGLFIAFLGMLSGITPGSKPDDLMPDMSTAKKAAEKIKETASSTTKFDFYTLLPEREVIVPEQDSTPEPEASEQFQYILQAGSFKSSQDADRLRAELILLGMEAKVDPVSSNGSTWHRVQVGPFTSRSRLSAARSTLFDQGIDALLIKRKLEQ